MQRLRKLFLLSIATFAILGFCFGGGHEVLAQSTGLDVGLQDIQETTGLPDQDIRVTIGNIISIVLGFLGVIALGVVLYGGVLYLTAGGRDDQVQKANQALINGAIGLIIVLSAYAITRFVVSSILDATGAGSSAQTSGSGGGYGGPGSPFGSGFSVASIVPSGSVPIRNVVVQINMSSNVDPSSAAGNVTVQAVGSSTPVDGVVSVSGSRIEFRPSEPCPTPNTGIGCFAENTTYDVTVSGGLRGNNGLFVNCGFSGCSETFTTGELVDTSPPVAQITYPTNNMSVGANPDLGVTVSVTDDAGVGTVEAFVDAASIGTDAPSVNTSSFVAGIDWSASGLALLSTHGIDATVTDIAGNTATASSVNVIVRADSCFDAEQNFDETGIDCGGDPASLTYCGACGGSACTTTSECSGGLICVEGSCTALPQINQVVPDNGAPGNYVTIQGVNLGRSVGEVVFLGDPEDPADDTEAALACGEGWSGSEVVVAVPNVPGGFPAGPIQVTTSSGDIDRTDDTVGSLIDFTVNTTVRPGICSITPNQGQRSSSFTINGTNLGSETTGVVYFDATSVPGSGIESWLPTQIQALVPPTDIGVKDVSVVVGSESSNPVQYNVQAPVATSGPSIAYVSPAAGAVGEYLTIFGSNFGTSEGTVTFTNPETGWTQVGDTDFPEACVADTWNSGSITVKVPAEYRDSVPANQAIAYVAHNLTVTRADGQASSAVSFEVQSGVPGPGICGLAPASGPTGIEVNVYGENFGNSTDIVAFNGASSSAVTSNWDPNVIAATVPGDATTGEVTVTVGSQTSNAVNFEVGTCTPGAADSCEAGYRCCANTLACTPNALPCEVIPPETNYLFEFSTGPIPVYPRVLQQCDGNVISPSPWGNRSGGASVCVNAQIRADFNVDMDTSTFNAANVLIEPCIDSDPEAVCDTLGPAIAGTMTVAPTTLTVVPVQYLDAATTYQVTLTDAIRAAGVDGEFLQEPYIYTFTTRANSAPCDVQEVIVTPGRTTLTEEGNGDSFDNDNGDVRLQASGIGDDACVMLSLAEPVVWSTSNNGGPAIQLNTVTTDDALIDVQALRETVNNAATAIATLVNQGLFGQSLITVNFTDPIVQNYWPNCQEACLNAQLGMQFNTDMDGATLIPNQTVVLEQCANELCLAYQNVPVSISSVLPSVDDNGLGRTWVIDPASALQAGAFYRVIIDATVQSESGVALTGQNYGSDYSWTFRVSPDGQLCEISRVDVTPQSVTLQAIGDQQPYSVAPMGPPDDCSAFGQRLDATDFDWDWTSSNTDTAYLLTDAGTGALFDLGQAPGCTDSCVLAGSQSSIGVCGDGIPDYGEECDDGNAVGGDGCSASCTFEGLAACSLACSNTGAACSADADCADTCQAGICSVSGGACSTDVDCVAVAGTCEAGGFGCCGNGVQEPFEQCDDGNAATGDGCSAVCLNEGSAAVGAVCGNGAIAYDPSVGGESCDDGNQLNGDGCSSICLWEGSSSSVSALCGNGVVESLGGEECDDGNAQSGDGCSASCLFEGGVQCGNGVGTPCCGDGIRQSSNFEQCDGGEGCSDSCLLLGSSLNYATASFCGDGVVGIGESSVCEAGVNGDGRIDPFQIAEVSSTLAQQTTPPANGLYTTNITATEVSITPNTADEGILNVQCSCQASSDCASIAGGDFACGAASGCCVPRPQPPTATPVGADVCRNTQVRIIFSERMDNTSFFDEETGVPNVGLRAVGLGEGDCTVLDGYSYVAAEQFNVAFLPNAVNRLLMRAWRSVSPETHALAPGCYVPTEARPLLVDGDHTEVILSYSVGLEALTSYEVVVAGDPVPLDGSEVGVRTVLGAGYDVDNYVLPSFTTGTEVCELDLLNVEDETGTPYYATANTSHDFVAEAVSIRAGVQEVIEPIPGVYDWTVEWTLAQGGDVLQLSDGTGNDESIASQTTNGNDNVTATAIITTDTLNAPQFPGEDPNEPDGTEGRDVSASVPATVFICELPWPAVGQLPLSDTEGNDDGLLKLGEWTNFQTAYCRAQENPEVSAIPGVQTAQAQNVALPAFEVTQVSSPTVGVEKEFIFRHPTQPEAIGIRVIDNIGDPSNGDPELYEDSADTPGFLSAEDWYREQGFQGAPSETFVDGYRGVTDGRTTYVSAPSVDSDTGLIEPKIFAISYSEGASPETLDVYNQILNNFTFLAATEGQSVVDNIGLCVDIGNNPIANLDDGGYYSCSSRLECLAFTGDSEVECDANRDQLRRDMQRIEDMRIMEDAVTSYGEGRRHCSTTTNLVCVADSNCPTGETCEADVPLLDAGTFIRGWSTSAWPSWNAELANEVGRPLPTDPLNAHATCTGYDSQTCWNGETNEYYCSPGSHVYRYNRYGLEQYTLSASMEIKAASGLTWAAYPYPLSETVDYQLGGLPYGVAVPGPDGSTTVTSTVSSPDSCSTVVGLSEVCGDGVLGGSEVCEVGQTSQTLCDADGDGTLDGLRTTVCADGSNDPAIAACSAFVDTGSACVPFSCGNGVAEGVCVGGSQAGSACLTDGVCGAGTCSFDPGDGAEMCDDGELNGLYGFCSSQCDYSTNALICGNGVVEGPEVCDCGTDANGLPVNCTTTNGSYSASGNSCAWNCSGAGPRCGDGIVAVGYEQCDTESETWSGALCVNISNPGGSSWNPCTSADDCSTGEVCGDVSQPASLTCAPQNYCVGGSNDGATCTTSANCGGGGICTSFDTFRSRTCESSGALACTWGLNGGWSACQQQGSCGNGIVDGGEQCDDGNSNNGDGCTNVCQFNVCGDGFLNPAVESCDLGDDNGQPCTAGYGGTCSYCTQFCSYQTQTGGFCGDGQLQIEAGEICDGTPPYYYANIFTNELQGVCDTLGVEHPTLASTYCSAVGACNGGNNNGDVCLANSDCTGGGTCEYAECSAGCGTSCPYNYESIYVLGEEWEYESSNDVPIPAPGATQVDTLELYSYATNGVCEDSLGSNPVPCNTDDQCATGVCLYENQPNLARISFPDCRVGNQLLANVTYNFTYPELDVVFVVDASASMNNCINGVDGNGVCNSPGTRWDVMKGALQEAVAELHGQYPTTVRIGFVTFGGYGLDDLAFNANNSSPWVVNGYNMLESSSDCVAEPYWDDATNTFAWPANWQDIEGAGSPSDDHDDVAACIRLAPDPSQGVVESFVVNELNAPNNGQPTGNGTSTAAGLYRAIPIMEQFPATNERVVVLLSDGPPTCSSGSPDKYADPDCKPAADAIFEQTQALKEMGVKVYTAYFGEDPAENIGDDSIVRKGQMFNIFSSDCSANLSDLTQDLSGLSLGSNDVAGVTYYSRYASCVDTPAYSYFGSDVSAFDDMFDGIIDNLLNARLYVGTEGDGQTSTLLQPGNSVAVPLPDNFVCPVPGDGTVELKLSFPGEGTVTLSNFQFQYCSE